MNKNMLLSVLLVIVVAGALGGIYYWQIVPMKAETEAKRLELENEEKYLAAIQGEEPKSTEINLGTTVELQKKLPVKPIVEQLLLDIQKAEVVSNSTILNMTVNQEELEGQEGEDLTSKDYNNFNLQEESDKASEDKEEENTNENQSATLPGLKKVTVTLNVQSKTYMDLQSFLASIERMKRIMKVESLTFTGEEEIMSVEQEREPLAYTVVVSAYYAPVLADLQKDLPQMEKSKPAEKLNPMSTSASVTE